MSAINENLIDLKFQWMFLDSRGQVLDSNDRLFTIDKEAFNLFEAEVFYAMDAYFETLEIGESFKLDCVETDFCDHHSIYDFSVRVVQNEGGRAYVLTIYDLEEVYQKVVDLRHERNEAVSLSGQLKVAYAKLEEAYEKQRESNRQLQEMQLQILYQEKMASVGQLATGMAHEINNPLNYILNGIVVLKDSVNQAQNIAKNESRTPSALDQVVSIIEQGAERIQEVVQQLQAFNDFGSSERKWVNIHDNLDQVIDLLIPQLKENIEVTKVYDQSFNMLCCIPRKINQVLLNLLTNASSFIPDERQGKIEIRTEWEEYWLEISIKDNGAGISEEAKKHIFDPFFTTKEAGSGKGLGLSVSYKIVEEHGGKLMFDSQDKETTFRLVLPLGDDDEG